MLKFRKTSITAGLSPGTPVYVGDIQAQETTITVISYDDKEIVSKKIDSVEAAIAFKDKNNISWININGLGNGDLIANIMQRYGLHGLTIEDIFNTEQRPKLDVFDDHVFITLKAYMFNQREHRLEEEQISIIFGKNYVITLQEKASDVFSSILKRLENTNGNLRKYGSDYLAYALIDIIVDSYFSVLETVGDVIEDLEEDIVSNFGNKSVQRINRLKREVIFLRKAVWPLREIISGMQRKQNDLISDITIMYLKDVYDHTIQVIDTVETYRDLLAGMLDLYMSTISNKLNEIMKVLTMFATIFIPLTFVTSLYGMNFDTKTSPLNMPELNWYYGYPFLLAVLALIVIVMLVYFKKKKWL